MRDAIVLARIRRAGATSECERCSTLVRHALGHAFKPLRHRPDDRRHLRRIARHHRFTPETINAYSPIPAITTSTIIGLTYFDFLLDQIDDAAG